VHHLSSAHLPQLLFLDRQNTMGFPWAQIESAGGMRFYDDDGPLKSKHGVLIAIRDGVFICAGDVGDSDRIGVLARFKSCPDTSRLLNALKDNSAMKKMYTLCKADVSLQTVVWTFQRISAFRSRRLLRQHRSLGTNRRSLRSSL